MAKALKTSAEGRKCAYPCCNRTLSIYNHEEYCHVHRGRAQDIKFKAMAYGQTGVK